MSSNRKATAGVKKSADVSHRSPRKLPSHRVQFILEWLERRPEWAKVHAEIEAQETATQMQSRLEEDHDRAPEDQHFL